MKHNNAGNKIPLRRDNILHKKDYFETHYATNGIKAHKQMVCYNWYPCNMDDKICYPAASLIR